MQRIVMLAALVAAIPPIALAGGPASTERAHPSASAHANATAGHASAARIEACTHVATTLIANLDKGDFKAATADFDATMTASIGADKLGAVWQQIGQQVGKLQGHGTPQNAMYQGDVVVVLPLHFVKGNLNAQVACDASGKVAGFFLRPAAAPAGSAGGQ